MIGFRLVGVTMFVVRFIATTTRTRKEVSCLLGCVCGVLPLPLFEVTEKVLVYFGLEKELRSRSWDGGHALLRVTIEIPYSSKTL